WTFGNVGAAVPDHHGAGTVVTFGDFAFEACIVERMIFGLHGEALVAGTHRRPLRHGPGLERAVDGQAKVVVQAGGSVLLYDKGVLGLAGGCGGTFEDGQFRSWQPGGFARRRLGRLLWRSERLVA